MKRVLFVLFILKMALFLSCKNASTTVDTDEVVAQDMVYLKIVVQGEGNAKLKLKAKNFTLEKLLSEIDGTSLKVPINQEITASLTSIGHDFQVPLVFWYGGAVNSLEQSLLAEPSIAFTLKRSSYLGIYIDNESDKLDIKNVVIDLERSTGSVIIFDKINRIGPLNYILPAGFLLDIEAKNFGSYKFESWKSENEVLSEELKYSVKIISDTNIKPVFTKSTTGDGGANEEEYIENFYFSAGANGEVEVVVKKGDVVESTTIVPSGFIVAVPINLKRFEDGSVTATAITNRDYFFEKWENADGATTPTFNVSITMADVITATFYRFAKEPVNRDGEWILVSEPAHLRWIADNLSPDNHINKYRLTDDIDYKGGTHKPIGTTAKYAFRGVINGNGKLIKNAKFGFDDSREIGFIGRFGTGGVVSNLTIDSSVIIDSSKADYVGSIAAYNDGAAGYIKNCVNNANIKVTGPAKVGGIIGMSLGSISNVHNSGNITVTHQYATVGGIVGFFMVNGSKKRGIINAYNTGNIDATSYYINDIGGVIGDLSLNDDTYFELLNVYSTAIITTHIAKTTPASGILRQQIRNDSSILNLYNSYFVHEYTTPAMAKNGKSDTYNNNKDDNDRRVESTTWTEIMDRFNSIENIWILSDGKPVIKNIGKVTAP